MKILIILIGQIGTVDQRELSLSGNPKLYGKKPANTDTLLAVVMDPECDAETFYFSSANKEQFLKEKIAGRKILRRAIGGSLQFGIEETIVAEI